MADNFDIVFEPKHRPRLIMRGRWDVEMVAIPNQGVFPDEAEALDWLLSPVRAE